MHPQNDTRCHLVWVEPLRALALIGILLNHFFEEMGSDAWFTNPSNNWPELAERIQRIYPHDYSSPIISFLQFIGWLGDSCPGVFILLSGFVLTWTYAAKGENLSAVDFYRRRLRRIYPLYIAMHFVTLAGALILPDDGLSLARSKTLLSLLGLRFDPSLFLFINPSWWFMWLIVQLYFVFPYLYRLMRRIGVQKFIVITFILTFAFRLYGILYSEHLYFWMTGIFFGTRLAEFTAGMCLAAILSKRKEEYYLPKASKIIALSLVLYSLGLLCSIFLIGSIFSNLLVTVGMTGLFYCIWDALIRERNIMTSVLAWIGYESYGIFLLHQAPMQWTASFLTGPWHPLGAAAVLFLSFPAASAINQAVSRLVSLETEKLSWPLLSKLSIFIAILAIAALMLIEPSIYPSREHRALALLFGTSFIFLCVVEYSLGCSGVWLGRGLRSVAILSIFLALFIFPAGHGFASAMTGAAAVMSVGAFHRILSSIIAALAAGTLITALLIVSIEGMLVYFHPLEVGQWGELAALQVHPTRTYALKPSQDTHLKYNNYDYTVKTNSYGLASPEIAIERPTRDTLRILVTGDAFSMPEGLNYEYSYPAILGDELSKSLSPRQVQVINAGVTGYGPIQESQQLKELLPVFKPDLVVYQYFINELDDVRSDQEVLLRSIGLRKRRMEILHGVKNAQFLAHSRAWGLGIAERITQKPQPWRYDKALLEYYSTREEELYSDHNIDKVRYYLRDMKETCRKQGAEMIIYFVPGAVAVMQSTDLSYFPWTVNLSDKSRYNLNKPLAALRGVADDLDIPVVDLTPHLRSSLKPTYFSDSWHWTAEGHKVAANVIMDDLKRRGFIN